MALVESSLPIINSTLITLGVAFVAYTQFKGSQRSTSQETIQLLKENISAKDGEIVKMKETHDSEIAQMKLDIANLTTMVENLKKANEVLQTTVSGRDILGSIVEILKPIPPLFTPGGFIEQVIINQQKVLKDLAELRIAMEKDPMIKTPENKQFKHRINPTAPLGSPSLS